MASSVELSVEFCSCFVINEASYGSSSPISMYLNVMTINAFYSKKIIYNNLISVWFKFHVKLSEFFFEEKKRFCPSAAIFFGTTFFL